MIDLRFETRLGAPAHAVFEAATTMAGVNDELAPLVRMTHPAGMASLRDADVPPGEVAFRSWLLALGVVPFDRHALVLERVLDGVGFDEESTSWLQRRWRHERRIEADGDGCVVTDHLVVEPRVRAATPLARWAVGRVFRHRHRRLLARFGPPAA